MTLTAPPVQVGRPATIGARGGGLILPPGAASTFGMPGPYVYDIRTARRIPAVGRAVQLYAGLVKQMPIDAVRGYDRVEPQPRILAAPDPDRGGSWFVAVNVEDYLLAGNAVALVTKRGADGWPLAVRWLEAAYTAIVWNVDNTVDYAYRGQYLPFEDVIHVRRGADRSYPVRGVGVVEEYLSTLDRVAMEEEYERGALAGGAVPSVAVVAPQSQITQEVADEAKAGWLAKFSGPQREPVILPSGTQVIPLAWSPTDTQLVEARRMSLLDVANIFNLDGYWVGAPVAGMTYRTAGPQYQQILRTSLEPVLADFEDVWSAALLPRGTFARFRRSQLLREDLATSATAAAGLYAAGIWTQGEARVATGVPPNAPGGVGAMADVLAPAPASTSPALPAQPGEPTDQTVGGLP
jgi:HK97 family phage portal protein